MAVVNRWAGPLSHMSWGHTLDHDTVMVVWFMVHCFGCGAHGDSIDFVRHDQGLSFIEAIAYLADQAGLAVPQRTVRDVAKDAVVQKRHDLLDQAAQWMYASLQTSPLAMTYVQRGTYHCFGCGMDKGSSFLNTGCTMGIL